MRQYMQHKIRAKLAQEAQEVRRAMSCVEPATYGNVSDTMPEDQLPDGVADCTINGTLRLGLNSKLYNCVVGENVDLVVGDNCIIHGSIFIAERPSDESQTLKSSNIGYPTRVEIGDECTVMGCNFAANIRMGEHCLLLGCSFRRTIAERHYSATVPDTAIVVGNNAILVRSGIHANAVSMYDATYKDMVFGDSLVMLYRYVSTTACADVRFGDRILLCGYTEILKLLSVAHNLILSDASVLLAFTEDNEHRFSTFAVRYMVKFNGLEKVSIGDDSYIAATLSVTGQTDQCSGSYVLGADNIIVDTIKAPRDERSNFDYSNIVMDWKSGRSCTFIVTEQTHTRSFSVTPCIVSVKDGLNIEIWDRVEACPCNELHIVADGRFNI